MILGNLFERRASWSYSGLENPSVALYRALTNLWEPSSASGLTLSDEEAASVPDVFACHQVLAQDVAKTPIKLRRLRDDGRHEDADTHGLWEILRDLPNPETTAYWFRFEMQMHLLRHSKAYAQIVRNSRGEIASLWVLDPRWMTVDRDGLNRKRYTYRVPGGHTQTWIFDPDRPPIFELAYESPMRRCRELIALSAALEKFAAKFFANGARVSGVLEVPPGFSDTARKNLGESFAALYQSVVNSHKVPMLEHGVTFKPVTSPNNEAQFIETRKYVRTLIAGVHRVPPHKIGDLERATFSNIEHQSIDYVTGGLDPFYVCWEQAVRRDLLTIRQYPRYEAVFDREALIRSDMKSLHDALAVGRNNGIYSANDILRKLGENPIPAEQGGDRYLVNGNMIPMDKAGEKAPTPKPQAAEPPADEENAA